MDPLTRAARAFASFSAMNLPTDSMFEFDVRDASVDEIHARTAIYTASPVVAQMLDRIGWGRIEGVDGGVKTWL